MKKRKIGTNWKSRGLVLGLAFSMGLALCGCGAAYNNYTADKAMGYENGSSQTQNAAVAGGSYYMDAAEAPEVMYESASSETGSSSGSMAVMDVNRKLIRTVELSVETKEFDALMSAVTEQTGVLGGYIENMNTYNGSSYSGYRSSRSSSLTIRIPKDKLDGFLDTVSGISNVVRRSENVDDVTLTYVDLESHKEALKVEQERLMSLLEKAENLEDILIIESRLSDVRYQLESMESRLRTFDNQVDYSTVYLDISEVKELTPVEEKNGWQRMTEGFVNSLKNVGNGFKEFGIWVVVHIPYLVVWAAVIFAIVMFIKWLIRRAKKKKAKKLEAQNANK